MWLSSFAFLPVNWIFPTGIYFYPSLPLFSDSCIYFIIPTMFCRLGDPQPWHWSVSSLSFTPSFQGNILHWTILLASLSWHGNIGLITVPLNSIHPWTSVTRNFSIPRLQPVSPWWLCHPITSAISNSHHFCFLIVSFSEPLCGSVSSPLAWALHMILPLRDSYQIIVLILLTHPSCSFPNVDTSYNCGTLIKGNFTTDD